jgi:general nucleoside transport system permease protein
MANFTQYLKRIGLSFVPVFAALLVGSGLILLAGKNPFTIYANLLDAGFSCHSGPGRCALLTTLQFATPLILSGLAVVVAMRSGFFSIGQAGQMIIGGAAATWLGGRLSLPGGLHPAVALLGGAAAGAIWGLLPAILREFVGVNEIIVTLLLNPIAGFVVGFFRIPHLADSAKLVPLIAGTKISAGFLIAITSAILLTYFLWRSRVGFELRMTAQAPRFALFGGITPKLPILRAMMLSGALAGLAGAVEILGVQYRFVTSFSAITDFDGIIVAFAGHLHPLGVLLFGVLLGGLRSGSIVGLQIRSAIPRELGGALIALTLIFVATNPFFMSGKLKFGKRLDQKSN